MPMSSAAIAGISANGHRWKAEINMRGQVSRLGDEDSLKVGDVAAIRDSVIDRVKRFLASPASKFLDADDKYSFENALDDLEMCDDDIDEVRGALNELYDLFDYHRICVVG